MDAVETSRLPQLQRRSLALGLEASRRRIRLHLRLLRLDFSHLPRRIRRRQVRQEAKEPQEEDQAKSLGGKEQVDDCGKTQISHNL